MKPAKRVFHKDHGYHNPVNEEERAALLAAGWVDGAKKSQEPAKVIDLPPVIPTLGKKK